MIVFKTLFIQKIVFVCIIIISYIIIIGIFVVYPKIFCKEYKMEYFNEVNDSIICISIRYSLIVYYVLIALTLLCTIISAYITKFSKIVDPYSGLYPKKAKSNVLIFIPVYSENKIILENTLESVLLNDYPLDAKIACLVVDGCIVGKNNDDTTSNYAKQILNTTTNISFNKYYQVYVGNYKQMKYILVIKNKNSGKKDSFIFVKKCLYYCLFTSNINNNDDLYFYKNIGKLMGNINYILMLDTDTKLEESSITSLVNYLDSNITTAAVCGETSLIKKSENFLVMSQYFEYYITHYTLKSLENVFGNVLVLSGCFTLYRKDVLVNKELINLYSKEEKDTLCNANVTLLGEDRYLTNLITRLYPNLNTRYTEKAKCYTEAPSDLKTLICQRRRWTNSMIFCHLKLLGDLPKYNIFKKCIFSMIIIFELWLVLFMPLLISIGYYYVIIFLSNPPYNTISITLTVIFTNIPIIMCIILKNFNMIKYAFVFQFILPFFSIIIPIYSIFVCDDISWGKTREINNDGIVNKNSFEEVITIPRNTYKRNTYKRNTIDAFPSSVHSKSNTSISTMISAKSYDSQLPLIPDSNLNIIF